VKLLGLCNRSPVAPGEADQFVAGHIQYCTFGAPTPPSVSRDKFAQSFRWAPPLESKVTIECKRDARDLN
jgi:hypothetical protein